jgi:REP element-mobilizing transposase RayT
MSKTYTRIIYQIVLSTKHRRPTMLGQPERERLFLCIRQQLEYRRCHFYQIGGVEDHLHIVLSLHPSVALSSLVKDIKLGASAFIKAVNLFPYFDYWQVGYGAFTYTPKALPRLIPYVRNQVAHHRGETSADELRRLLELHGIEYEEHYFE